MSHCFIFILHKYEVNRNCILFLRYNTNFITQAKWRHRMHHTHNDSCNISQCYPFFKKTGGGEGKRKEDTSYLTSSMTYCNRGHLRTSTFNFCGLVLKVCKYAKRGCQSRDIHMKSLVPYRSRRISLKSCSLLVVSNSMLIPSFTVTIEKFPLP